MKSPLDYDKAITKEFGIDTEIELEDIFRLAHVRTQLEEVKKFLWRERVELLLAEAQSENAPEAVAATAKGKIAEHRSNLRGVVASLRLLTKLKDELEAAIPNEG